MTFTSNMLESSPPHLRLEARAKERQERQQYYSQVAELSRQEKQAKQNAQQQRVRMERARKSYPVTPERKEIYSVESSHATEKKRRQSIEISVIEYATPNKRQADIYTTPRPEAPKLFVEQDKVASPESPVEFGRHTATRAKECLERTRANKLAEKKALAKSVSAEKQINRKSYALEYLQTLFDEHSEVSFGRYTAARAQVSQEKSLAHQKETEAALQNTLSPSKRKETEGFTTPKAKKNKAVPSTVPFGRHTAARAKISFRKKESILMDPEMLQSNDKPRRLNIPPKLRSASRAREREERQKHFSETAEKVQEEKRKKVEAKRQEVELQQLKKSLAPVYTPPPERLLNADKVFGVHSAARALESYRYRSPKNEKPKFKARDVPSFPEDNVHKSKGFLLFQKSRHEKFESQQKEEKQNAQAFDFKPRSLPSTTFQESQPAALQEVTERNKKRREAIEKRRMEKEKQRLEQMKFVASPVPASCRRPHSTFKRNEEEALKKADLVREQKMKELEKGTIIFGQKTRCNSLADLTKYFIFFPQKPKVMKGNMILRRDRCLHLSKRILLAFQSKQRPVEQGRSLQLTPHRRKTKKWKRSHGGLHLHRLHARTSEPSEKQNRKPKKLKRKMTRRQTSYCVSS